MRSERFILSAFIILSLASIAGAQAPAVQTRPSTAPAAAKPRQLQPDSAHSRSLRHAGIRGHVGPRLERLKTVMQESVDQGRIAASPRS